MKATIYSKLTIATIATAVAAIAAPPAAARLQILWCDPNGCTASVVLQPASGQTVISNAGCNGPMHPGNDFGLAITVTNVASGTCTLLQGSCQGACRFHVQVQYVTYDNCYPLDLTGTECGSAITPQTGLPSCGACTVVNQDMPQPCGTNCVVAYTLTEPINNDQISVQATLGCSACPE